jgi:hypothetical protein
MKALFAMACFLFRTLVASFSCIYIQFILSNTFDILNENFFSSAVLSRPVFELCGDSIFNKTGASEYCDALSINPNLKPFVSICLTLSFPLSITTPSINSNNKPCLPHCFIPGPCVF